MRGHAVIGESPVSGFVPRWIEGWLLPGLMLFRKKMLSSDDWRFWFRFQQVVPQQFISELMPALRVCVEKMQPGTDSI